MGRRLTTAIAVFCLPAIAPGSSAAGGNPPTLAACGETLWITSDAGVVEADAATGRTLRILQASRPYATGVVCAAGRAYVSSVESGYVASAVDRFDAHTGRRTRIDTRSGGIFGIALASGRLFVIAGSTTLRVVELAHGGQPERAFANGHPAWISGGSALTIVDESGALRRRAGDGHERVLASGAGWPAVACGSGILAAAPGRVRLVGGATPWSAPGRPVALACDHASAWVATTDASGLRTTVRRRHLSDGRTLRGVHIAGSAVAVARARRVVWIATAGSTERLVGLDPHTLRVLASRAIL